MKDTPAHASFFVHSLVFIRVSQWIYQYFLSWMIVKYSCSIRSFKKMLDVCSDFFWIRLQIFYLKANVYTHSLGAFIIWLQRWNALYLNKAISLAVKCFNNFYGPPFYAFNTFWISSTLRLTTKYPITLFYLAGRN